MQRRTHQQAESAGAFESGALDQMAPGTFAALAQIHRALFVDIYDFAGDLRTVNIAKAISFCIGALSRSGCGGIERMPQNNFDEIVAKYVEMNVAHPFREGNGRSMRIWLDQMLKAALGRLWIGRWWIRRIIFWRWSAVRCGTRRSRRSLGAALTDRGGPDRAVYEGIDRSYEYERLQRLSHRDAVVGHA